MKLSNSRPLSSKLLRFIAIAAVPALIAPMTGCTRDDDDRVDERRIAPRDGNDVRPVGTEPGGRMGTPPPGSVRDASDPLPPASDPIRINDGPATPGSNGTVAPQSGTGDSNDRPTRPGSSPPGTYAEPRSDGTAPRYNQPVYDAGGVLIPGQSTTVIAPGQVNTNQSYNNQPIGGTTSNGQPIYQGIGSAPAGSTQQPGTPATPQQPIRQQLPPVPVTSNRLPSGSVNNPTAQPNQPLRQGGQAGNSTFTNAPATPQGQVGLQPGQNTQDTSRNARTPAVERQQQQNANDNRNNSGNNNAGNNTNANQNNQPSQGSSAPRGGTGAPAGGTGAPAGGTGAPAGGSGGGTGGGGN